MQKIKLFFTEAYYFVSSKIFLKNLAYILGSFVVLLFLLFWLLGWYTLHGESTEVPNVTELSIQTARQSLEARSLKIQVIDSLYREDKEPGTILEQYPAAKTRVKESRTIYVVINASAPPMVNLYYNQVIGRNLNDVRRKFENLNFKIGKVELIAGRGENTIAEVSMDGRVVFMEADPSKGVKPPKEPYRLPRGSVLNLKVYQGDDASLKQIPDLVCLPYSAVEFQIKGGGFMVGNVVMEGGLVDTTAGYVWKQNPIGNSLANMGTGVDVWLVAGLPEACADKLNGGGNQ